MNIKNDSWIEPSLSTCTLCGIQEYWLPLEDGEYYCFRCIEIPDLSPSHLKAISCIQHRFRARFQAEAKACIWCKRHSLVLYPDINETGLLCSKCKEIDDKQKCKTCDKTTCYCEIKVIYKHYCGDINCEWDCGTLSCGCIDVCRGRCGLRRWERW
jgi:hypothetical protein